MSGHLIPVRMAISKKPQIINVGEDMEKMEPWYTVGGNVNWNGHYGKEHWVSSKKLKNRATRNYIPGNFRRKWRH